MAPEVTPTRSVIDCGVAASRAVEAKGAVWSTRVWKTARKPSPSGGITG